MSELDKTGTRRPLGNILVATDFSAGAAHALARAGLLPVSRGSEITILHVLPPEADSTLERAARRTLDQASDAMRTARREHEQPDVSVLPQIAHGKPFVEIIHCARHARAQLIVLGRHGQRTFRELLLGSTAERVTRKGPAPVLVVNSAPAGPYRRPLVAVDGSHAAQRAFELALRIGGANMRHIEVVHAYNVSHEGVMLRAGIPKKNLREYYVQTKNAARAVVDEFLSACGEAGPAARVALRRGDPRRVILQVAAQHRSDLLVLATHGRSGPTHVLIGSVAEAVVRAARCDVLVERPGKLSFKLP